MLKLLRQFMLLFSSATMMLVLSAPIAAASSSSTQAVVQSYTTTEALQTGMIVGLVKSSASQVQALSMKDITTMQGVVVSPNNAAISLNNGSSSNQIYVATSGSYSVLVSTENGAINIGDYISISSLDGIGMKAQDSEVSVVGKASQAFNGKTNTVSTATIKKGGGGTTQVTIGLIPVSIGITTNPNQQFGVGGLPGFLQAASSSIANKPVSAPKVYISLLVLILTILISGSLLYSGVKNSIVSIGRNPLARRYIIRGLTQVVLFGVIIFVIGLFAVYLLLKL